MYATVNEISKDPGHLFPQLHHHPLYYDITTLGHRCDFCRSRIREAYRCSSCDYDLCMTCFKFFFSFLVLTHVERRLRPRQREKIKLEVTLELKILKFLQIINTSPGLSLSLLTVANMLLPHFVAC